MNEIDLIQTFEKDFVEAGKLAMRLRKNATVEDKFNSGIKDIDIVTSSDLAVQEFILKKLSSSELKNCEIVAEENTPSKNLFAKSSDLVITVDPIDGTMFYATDKKMYSIIVTLHNKKEPLYTFDYFPEMDWGTKIIKDRCEFLGDKPDLLNGKSAPKTIVYSGYGSKGNPEKCLPDLYEKLIGEGYQFIQKRQINGDLGMTAQFISGSVDGYFIENGSAVDCLVALHFALANNYKIYQDLDISKTVPSIQGGSEEYKGYYLVLKK